MSTKAKEYVPLMHVLRKLSNEERQIILSHLDHKSCDQIRGCVGKVLKRKNKLDSRTREKLKQCIRENEHDFETIFSSRSEPVRRRAIARVGGNPLALLLGVGLPMLLDLILKK